MLSSRSEIVNAFEFVEQRVVVLVVVVVASACAEHLFKLVSRGCAAEETIQAVPKESRLARHVFCY